MCGRLMYLALFWKEKPTPIDWDNLKPKPPKVKNVFGGGMIRRDGGLRGGAKRWK